MSFYTHGAENKIKWKNVYIEIFNETFVIGHCCSHWSMSTSYCYYSL